MAGLAGIAAGIVAYWLAAEAGRQRPWVWALAAWLVAGLVVLEVTA